MSAPVSNSKPRLARVLLIADDPLAGETLRTQLALSGHEVHWARDTMEARWLWHPKFYDVIVVDLRRDSSSGTGFAHRIKTECPEQKIAYVSEVERQKLSKKSTQTSFLNANPTGRLLEIPKW